MATIEFTAIVDPLPGQELPFAAPVALRAGLVVVFLIAFLAILVAPRRKTPRLRLVHSLPTGGVSPRTAQRATAS